MNVITGAKLTKDRPESIVTVPIAYGCKTLYWPNNPSGNKMINKVNNLQFNVKGADVTVSSKYFLFLFSNCKIQTKIIFETDCF